MMEEMPPQTPQNPLYERYASPEMARIFSARHRFALWRGLWIGLAEIQREPAGVEGAAVLEATPFGDPRRIERATEA